jgi:hypothetical protein
MRASPPPLVTTTPAVVGPGPAVVVQTQSKSTRFVFGCLAAVIVAVLLFFLVPLIAALVLPAFAKSRSASQRAVCVTQLKTIDGAKATWALTEKKENGAVPNDWDLFGPGKYVESKPLCPAGGIYTLNAVWTNPVCSIPGHTF